MTAARPANRANIGTRLRRAAPAIISAIPVLMIPTLEYIPGMSSGWRAALILGSVSVAAIGFYILNKKEQHLEGVAEENARMKRGIAAAQPESLLGQVAQNLFRQGAWRLTVYQKVHSPDRELGDHLIKLCSVASDGDQRDLGASKISITPSTMFEFYFRSNLADPSYRRPEQTGYSPEDVHSQDWSDWREGIFGTGAFIDDKSTFHPRRFAWFAAQDPETQTVFAAIAESADADGIVIEHLDNPFTSGWLFFVSRLAELRTTARDSSQ